MPADAPAFNVGEPSGGGAVIRDAHRVRPFRMWSREKIGRGAEGHACSETSEGQTAPACPPKRAATQPARLPERQ